MSKNKETKRFRNMMYTQQIEHLPEGKTVEDIFQIVEELNPKKWAGIVHEKDVKDDNTLKKPHIHIMMQFENAHSINSVAKSLGDKSQYLEKWDGRVNNGFAYLIHATAGDRHKHQYSCEDVTANFDYAAFIEKEMKKALKNQDLSSRNKINGLLDLIAVGELSLKEAKKALSGSDYAKNAQKLVRAHELFLERQSIQLHEEMIKNNELVSVYWFYGPTETGKTFLAEKLAKEQGSYYLTSTTNDPFQFYQAEPIIILDELRPRIIPFAELLSMFNPFSGGKVVVSSRFYNKPLACRIFYITSPFDPVTFYTMYHLTNKDSGIQLYRRLSSVVRFDQNYIYDMKYEKISRYYRISNKKENPYSRKNQNAYVLNNIFDQI